MHLTKETAGRQTDRQKDRQIDRREDKRENTHAHKTQANTTKTDRATGSIVVYDDFDRDIARMLVGVLVAVVVIVAVRVENEKRQSKREKEGSREEKRRALVVGVSNEPIQRNVDVDLVLGTNAVAANLSTTNRFEVPT